MAGTVGLKDGGALRQVLAGSSMTVVDAGCAGGIDPVFLPLVDGKLAIGIGFEANPDEFRKLRNTPATRYYNLALSDRKGSLTFNALGTIGSVHQRHDRQQQYGEVYRPVEVACNSLDQLCDEGILPSIEVLKLDVEGYESTVLKGASRALAQGVLCVKAEFGFHAETGTNRFSELHDLLQSQGFRLFGLALANAASGGYHSGDALWLKAPEAIMVMPIEAAEKRNRLVRLAAIAFMLRQIDYVAMIAETGAGVLSAAEKSELDALAVETCFIPNLIKLPFPRLAFAFFLLCQLALGRTHGTKAAPKVNRLVPLRPLFVAARLDWMRRRHVERQKTRLRTYLHSERLKV